MRKKVKPIYYSDIVKIVKQDIQEDKDAYEEFKDYSPLYVLYNHKKVTLVHIIGEDSKKKKEYHLYVDNNDNGKIKGLYRLYPIFEMNDNVIETELDDEMIQKILFESYMYSDIDENDCTVLYEEILDEEDEFIPDEDHIANIEDLFDDENTIRL